MGLWKRLRLVFSLWGLCLTLGFGCAAQANGKTLFYPVTSESWAPYWVVEGDQVSGILADVMIVLRQRTNLPLQPTKPLPLNRSKIAFDEGEVALECCVNPAWRGGLNAKGMVWTVDIMLTEDILIYPFGRPLDFTGPSSLTGKKIGTILGYGYVGSEFFQRVDSPNNTSQIRMVDLKEVDAAIINSDELAYRLARMPPVAVLQGPIYSSSPLKIRLREQYADLVGTFNHHIIMMIKEGVIDDIRTRNLAKLK